MRQYCASLAAIAARYFETTRSVWPDGHDPAVVQPHRAIAESLHVAGGVRHEENGDSAGAQFVNLAHAALAEVNVADGEGFVHQQNLGIEMDGDREGEPHDHAAGIGLDRLVDEVADLGEVGDFREPAIHLFGRKARGWLR